MDANACLTNQNSYKFLEKMNSFRCISFQFSRVLIKLVWFPLNKICLNQYLYIQLLFVFLFLYSQVSEPILAKTFHRKVQSKKIFTHRESFDAIIAKTEEKLAQVRINKVKPLKHNGQMGGLSNGYRITKLVWHRKILLHPIRTTQFT